jgi:hypothetical protein
MNPDYLPIVNELNLYWGQIGPRESYLFYSNALPKRKQYNKWIKATSVEEYEEWLVEIIRRHHECSNDEARTYLTLFYRTDESKIELRSIVELYGVDAKKMKKVGLL